MSIDNYIIFLTITAVFMASPGPAILLCINNGVQHGVRLSAFAVLGNILAFQIMIVLSAIGVGSILATSITFFYLLKIIGALYLLYLGLKLWFTPVRNLSSLSNQVKKHSAFSLFRQAFLVTATNPKALIYITALLPQFIDIQQPILAQVITLNPAIAVLQFIIFISYIIAASQVRRWLQYNSTRLWFNRVTALIFISFAVTLGLSEQHSMKAG